MPSCSDLALLVSGLCATGLKAAEVFRILSETERWMHTGLKRENAEAIINCLSALLPRAISVLISHKVIFTWDHCAVLSSLLSALLDSKRFLGKLLTKEDAMFCEFVLRGNSVFLIDVLVQMLNCDHHNAFVRAIFERVQSLTVRHFTHPQQAVRLLIFAKWCSAHQGLPVLQFKDLLQNRINSATVVEWIKKKIPSVLCGGVLQAQDSEKLLQSLYKKLSLEQLVDLLNWDSQIEDTVAERPTSCASFKKNPEQFIRSSRGEYEKLNFFKEKNSEIPSTFPLVESMDFDLIESPPHWLSESIESFLSEMPTASEADPEAVATETSANGGISDSVQLTKRELTALIPLLKRKSTLNIIYFLGKRKRIHLDTSLESNSKSQKKRKKSQLTVKVDRMTIASSVASGNSTSLEEMNKTSPETLLPFNCDRSPCLKSPALCANNYPPPLPSTCITSGSPSTVTYQGDRVMELDMFQTESTNALETDASIENSSNKSHAETITHSVCLSAERLRIGSSVNESWTKKSSTVTSNNNTQHSEVEILPSGQTTVSVVIQPNISILTAKPILGSTPVTMESTDKCAESKGTKALNSPVVVRVLSPKADARTPSESHATIFVPLSSPDDSSKGQVRRTRTGSQFPVDSTQPHENKVSTSSRQSKSPERVLENAVETILPTRPGLSPTFGQDHFSLDSVAKLPAKNEINHGTLKGLNFGPLDSLCKGIESTNLRESEPSSLVPTDAHKTLEVSQKVRSSTGERLRQQPQLSPPRSAPDSLGLLCSTTDCEQRNKDIGKSSILSQSSDHQISVRNADHCSFVQSPARYSPVCFSVPICDHNHVTFGAAIDSYGSDLATPTKCVRNSREHQSPGHLSLTESPSNPVISLPSCSFSPDSEKPVSEASSTSSILVDEHSNTIPWSLRSSKRAGGDSAVLCTSRGTLPKNKSVPTAKHLLNSPDRKSNFLRCVMTLLSGPLSGQVAVLSSLRSTPPLVVRKDLSSPRSNPEAVPVTPRINGIGPLSKTGNILDISERQCPSLQDEQSSASSSNSEHFAATSPLATRSAEKRHLLLSMPTPEKNLTAKTRSSVASDGTPSRSIRKKSPDSGSFAKSSIVASQTAVNTSKWSLLAYSSAAGSTEPDDIMNVQEYHKPSTSVYPKSGTPVVEASVKPVRVGTRTRRSMEKLVNVMGDVDAHTSDPHNKHEEIPIREPYSLRERRFAK
ncbi:hypothetical protein FGIG_01861 [Fasciola gigantica]|uniref:Uncharacterized protein n=1 Tax=Fasciola gigantica TaxID=46835 RepID=A0A504YZF8_FASGI|nr:hypothetical protein FGIG_01861 [Fasciola gigantica]